MKKANDMIWERIREFPKGRNLSKLSKELGRSSSYLGTYKHGNKEIISLLPALAEALGTTEEYLLNGTPSSPSADVPQDILDTFKARAKHLGIDYRVLIDLALREYLADKNW